MPATTDSPDLPAVQDLGPLAWVREELRRTMESATKELRRYVREADASAQGSGFAAPDLAHLAQAGHLLHQCSGALALVEHAAPATMLQAMEAATQHFADHPETCTHDAVTTVERASFAVNDYLDAVLADKPVSAVGLFPQYRDVQALAGSARIHPADLWSPPWQWTAPTLPAQTEPLAYGPAVRSRLDQAVLKSVKSGDPAAARELHAVALGLAAGATELPQRAFWSLAAGYFEALSLDLVPTDLYAKRIASRVLTQYAALARGEALPAERLAQDLLFYCARAVPPADAEAATLTAVRAAHGVEQTAPVDYEARRFGRFDPTQLAQARKRMAAASETWSALAGGDTHQFKVALDQFAMVGESLTRLHPDSAVLTRALQHAVETAARADAVPPAALAMEVATAVLYLEAAYDELDQDDAAMRARAELLADRLARVLQGGEPEPLQPWMEELYHRVSERQTMGSVVGELRRTLADIEQSLDQFFRAPREKGVLGKVIAQLTQMRGVLSVLGLDEASHAVARMRETVDGYMADALDDGAARAANFDRLGSSLGALGLMVDMLGYQRALAQQLFVYDEDERLFRLAAGQPAPSPELLPEVQPAATPDAVADAAIDAAADAVSEAPGEAAPLADTALPDRDTAAPEARLDFEPTDLLDALPGLQAETDAPVRWAPLDLDLDLVFPPAPATPRAEEDEAPVPPEPTASDLAPLLAEHDEHVKQIGPLRIGLSLYNVYLNEADEWSRQLLTELSEWQLEWPQPPQAHSTVLAHSLAGSSATVGFVALSRLARTLEGALGRVQMPGLPQRGIQAFLDAAEEIRRLLHQFAAGFLKEPNPAVQQALDALLQTQASDTAVPDPEHEAQSRSLDDAMAVAVATGSAFDDDIAVLDTVDPDLFPIFDEEAAELLPRLSEALRQWWAEPGDADARGVARRALHTLKGSARLAGALRLGELAHRLESAIDALGADAVQPVQIEPLLTHFDALQADLELLRTAHQQGRSGPLALPPVDGDPAAADDAAAAAIPTPQVLVPRPLSQQSVRVPSQLLDRLISQTGEVLITRARLEARLDQLRGALGDLGGNLDRLRHQLRDIELQSESQMQSRLTQARDAATTFDPLEFDRFTRVQELTRMMAESVNDIATVQRSLQRSIEGTEDDLVAQGRQARELQHDLLRTRMVAFDSIAERLHGVVRQTAQDLGRQVQLEIRGGSIELDRGVLERLAPAFDHLLRNAVVHGIETDGSRAAAGKPATGSIAIALQHAANDIAVSVRDDGRGLDLPRIQARALALGLLSSGKLLSADEAADLIFLPGFSTASEVTALAGRGIGMDVVRAEVQALGGRIETRSASGEGTEFELVLPLTTAVTRVVMLRAGPQCVGVPTNLVEAVRRVPTAELAEAYQSERFVEGGEALPFYWGGALLQSSAVSQATADRHASVLVLRSASQRLALHVDEVLGQQEVVVKNLGPQLSRLPGLAGMSVLASGAVVLIYNPVALASVHGVQARQAQHDHALRSGDGGPATQQAEVDTPLVLVVDDSVTVRRVTQRLLQREGYRVALAADGLQALEMLQQERPALVLSDIEMPRMDGFDLVRNIRADAALQNLPVVMITSRMADKHRDHALAIGVEHYLGKPYAEEELLSLVRRYTAATLPESARA